MQSNDTHHFLMENTYAFIVRGAVSPGSVLSEMDFSLTKPVNLKERWVSKLISFLSSNNPNVLLVQHMSKKTYGILKMSCSSASLSTNYNNGRVNMSVR